MSTKFNRKPPLAKSPVRSAASVSVQTPPGPGSMRKSALVTGRRDAKEMGIKPEFDSISCDLQALARMVSGKNESKGERNGVGLSSIGVNNSLLFERGRFYDLYSAKRNERLKRKLGIELEVESSKRCCSKYELGVAAGTMKRRDSKRLEGGRKSLPVDLRNQPQRYSLRSSKDNMKPLLSTTIDRSYGVDDAGGKKTIGSARRVVRKI